MEVLFKEEHPSINITTGEVSHHNVFAVLYFNQRYFPQVRAAVWPHWSEKEIQDDLLFISERTVGLSTLDEAIEYVRVRIEEHKSVQDAIARYHTQLQKGVFMNRPLSPGDSVLYIDTHLNAHPGKVQAIDPEYDPLFPIIVMLDNGKIRSFTPQWKYKYGKPRALFRTEEVTAILPLLKERDALNTKIKQLLN